MAIFEQGTIITLVDEGTPSEPVSLADIAAVTSGVQAQGTGHFVVNHTLRLVRSHFAQEGAAIFFNASRPRNAEHYLIEHDINSSVRFGRDDGGVSRDGCRIVVVDSPTYVWSARGEAGSLEMYATTWTASKRASSRWSFWRLYPANPDSARVIIRDCIFDGGSGIGRTQNALISGNLFLGCDESIYGPLTLKGPCVVKNNRVEGCLQSLYWSPYHSGDTRIVGLSASGNDADVSCGSALSVARRLELVDCVLNDPLIFVGNKPTPTSTVYSIWSYSAKVVCNDSSQPLAGASMIITDKDDQIVYEGTSDEKGKFPVAEVIYAQYESDKPDYRGPHRMRVRLYGRIWLDQPLVIEAPTSVTHRLVPNPLTSNAQAPGLDALIDVFQRRVSIHGRVDVRGLYDFVCAALAQRPDIDATITRQDDTLDLGHWSMAISDQGYLQGNVRTTSVVDRPRESAVSGIIEDQRGRNTVVRL